MQGKLALRGGVVVLLAVLPSYLAERITEYMFLSSNPSFFTWSGLRIELFISSILAGAILAGYLLDSLRLAASAYIGGIFVLLSLFFVLCAPRVCYNAGLDGWEPLRMGYFFSCLGLTGIASGNYLRTRRDAGRLSFVALNTAIFTALAYYPMMFSIAGAKLVAPLAPLPLALLVGFLSFCAAARVAERCGWRWGLASPLVASLLLLGLSLGVARQYLPEISPEILVTISVTVAGASSGVAAARARPTLVARQFVRSSKPIFLALLLVLIMMVAVLPDAVNGTLPQEASGGHIFGSPAFAGGIMAEPFVRTKGVSVVVNFSGTNATSIQSDNFLAAGIGIHSPNCCVDGIDYGYRFDAYLFHDGSEILSASAWEVCDFNMACGGHSWLNLMFFSAARVTAPSGSASLRLMLQWKNRTVFWSYSFNGLAEANFTSFRPPSQENPYFNAGSLPNVLANPESAGTFFFQFGIMSRYPIGHPGWTVNFACPAYLNDQTWICVSHALSLQGDQSYWKALWRWGETYAGVKAVPDLKTSSVTFSYSPSTLPDFQRFW